MLEIMEENTFQNILLTRFQIGGLIIVQNSIPSLIGDSLKVLVLLLEKFLQIH